jgi:beta-glucosidase
MAVPLYRNPAKPIPARVDDLLARMTTEEKVGQLMQLPGVWPHLKLEERAAAGQLGSILSVVGKQTLPFQQAALRSRLGIPLLVAIDAIHGHSMWHQATMFPSQLGLSQSWDEDLCRRVARATAVEVAHTGIHWTFSPVLCLPRDLRWGRTGETFGEDNLLIGRLGVAMIQGYQGDDLRDPTAIAACAKHFIGYGLSDGGRDASESHHSPRTLRAVFMPPFEMAFKAGCATAMSAYHTIDAVPVVFNSTLLTGVLRDEWKWEGLLVTDWDIVGRMHNDRRICATTADSAARAVEGGNDLVMTTASFFEDTLANLASGRISLAQIETACRRILTLKFRLGLFENPRLADEARAAKVSGTPAHRALAREAAAKSLVLLKNRGVLPLVRSRTKRIAVLGPASDHWLPQLGDWSLAAGQAQGQRDAYGEDTTVTVRVGLERLLGADAVVEHSVGCGVAAPLTLGSGPQTRAYVHPLGNGSDEAAPEKIAKAARLAAAAEVAVLVLGDTIPYIGEMKSTATLTLPGEQLALFEAVVATGTPVVVVLIASKPLAIPEVIRRADAVIYAANPGMEGGTAVAAALFGENNFSGKLTLSWPHHVGQLPVHYDQSPGAHHGSYPDLPGVGFEPLFAFGFGLSYTTLRYRSIRLGQTTLAAGQELNAEVTVANTGNRAVEEIVQVYLTDRFTSVCWPVKKLKAWQRVALAPGEERIVRFTIPYADLALCDAAGQWVVEPGDFELLIGGSSRDQDLLRAGFAVVAPAAKAKRR